MDNIDTRHTNNQILLSGSNKYHNDNSQLENEKLENDYQFNLNSIFVQCLYMGVISFGGPIAQLGIINKIFIEDHDYIHEKNFPELFAICNVVPGPTSTQLVTAISTIKTKSVLGGILGFLLFITPGLILVTAMATLMKNNSGVESNESVLEFYFQVFCVGISQGAVSIVAHTAIVLGRQVDTKFENYIMAGAGILYYFFNDYYVTVLLMCVGGFLTLLKGETPVENDDDEIEHFIPEISFIGLPSLIAFILVYFLIYMCNYFTDWSVISLTLMESFYRIGSFSEEQAIVPMLINEFVKKNLISQKLVVNAFSIMSLLPGPMFNIAAYVGTIMGGIFIGVLSAYSIFLPGILLTLTMLKFISFINNKKSLRLFLLGVNSAAIGFIFTAAFVLWVESCYNNENLHFAIASLNVVLCYILFDTIKLKLILVVLVGGSISVISTYFLS
jgi:chromate transporter